MAHLSGTGTIFVWAGATFTIVCFSVAFLRALFRERRTAVWEGILGYALLSLSLALVLVSIFIRSSPDIIGVGLLMAFFGMSRMFRFLHSPRRTDHTIDSIK